MIRVDTNNSVKKGNRENSPLTKSLSMRANNIVPQSDKQSLVS